MGASVLARLHMVHLYLPIGFLFFSKYGAKFFLKRGFLLYFVSSLALPLAWYMYAHSISIHSDAVYYDLSMQGGFLKRGLTENLFGPTFYQKFLDLLSQLDFTPLGFSFLIVGLFASAGYSHRPFLFIWLCSVLFYFLPLSDKVMNENFFTLPLVPIGAVFSSLGFEAVRGGFQRSFLGRGPRVSFNFTVVAALFFLLFSVRYFYHPLFQIPKEDENLLKVASEVKGIVAPDEILIAARGSAPDLLYYCDRNGWPFYLAEQKDFRPKSVTAKWNRLNPEQRGKMEKAGRDARDWLEFLRGEGADYFAASYPEEFFKEKELASYLDARYRRIPTQNDFILFDLRKEGGKP